MINGMGMLTSTRNASVFTNVATGVWALMSWPTSTDSATTPAWPLYTPDSTDDGPDDDADGLCNDGDEIYFSSSSIQYVSYAGSIVLVYPGCVYVVPPGVPSLGQFGPCGLSGSINLDALVAGYVNCKNLLAFEYF